MFCDRNNEYFPVVTILETGGGNLTGNTAAVFSNVPLFMILWYDEERFRGLKPKTRGVHRNDICGADDRVFTGWWLFKCTSILQLAHACTAYRVVTPELSAVDQRKAA